MSTSHDLSSRDLSNILKIGREKPGEGIAEFDGNRTAIDFAEGEGMRARLHLIEVIREGAGGLSIVDLQIEFEIQAQAPRI